MNEYRITVSARMRSNLDGSQLFQTPQDLEAHGYGEAGERLVAKVADAPPTRPLRLDRAELDVLYDLADITAVASRDDASYENTDALADLNSAEALVRQIHKAVREES